MQGPELQVRKDSVPNIAGMAVPPRSGVSTPPDVVARIASITARRFLRQAEVVEHQGDGPDRGDRVGDALPGDIRRGTVDRLEHARFPPLGVDVGAGGDAHAAGEGAAEIGEDVAEEVGGDDHIERFRPEHEAGSHRVDEPVSVSTSGYSAATRAKTSFQSVIAYCWALSLVTLVTLRRRVRARSKA